MAEQKHTRQEATPKDTSTVYGASKSDKGTDKGKMKKRLKWIFISLVILIIIAAAIVLPLSLGRADKDALIRVPRNATTEMVKDSVAKYLGDSYAGKVAEALKMYDFEKRNRHGAYLIEKGMTPLKAGRRISRGRQHELTLTINGIRTKEQLASYIASKLDITKEEMLAAFNDTILLAEFNTDPDKVIGFFLNDSYNYFWDSTPKEVIRKMRREYRKFWNNERQTKAEALRMSPRTVTILSSIVDEETNAPEEKGRVGRLYINRLNKDMLLQADPTVRYAIGDFTIRRISAEDTKFQSPYNTYQVKGLPPGPIRTPDPRTIDAILNSEPSEDLFMCADSALNGTHHFSRDYETHKKYAAEYQAALNRRNIKR